MNIHRVRFFIAMSVLAALVLIFFLLVPRVTAQTLVHPTDQLQVGVQDTLTFKVDDTDGTVISASYFKFLYDPLSVRIDTVYSNLPDWYIVGQDDGNGVLEVATLTSTIRAFDGDFFSFVVTPLSEGSTGLQVVDFSWTDCNDIIVLPPRDRPTNPTPEEVEALYTGTVYWIDADYGHDANPCDDFDLPCRTLSNIRGNLLPGDAVVFMEGVHRMSIRPMRSGTPSSPITYIGYPGMEVTISGADLFTNTWTPQPDGTWTASYTTKLPQHPAIAKPQVQWRPEMLIVDGLVYESVYNSSDVVDLSMYIEGPSTNPTSVRAGFGEMNPNFLHVEMAARDTLLVPTQNVDHIQVQDLKFTHAGNSFAKLGCFEVHGTNWLVSNVDVVECSTTGIKFYGSGHFFTNVRANYNGVVGWNSENAENITIQYSEGIGNNTKGFLPNWHAGGGKFTHGTSRLVITNSVFSDNNGPGIWFDIPWGEYNQIKDNMIVNNQLAGVFLEHGTIYSNVENNVIYGTRKFNGTGVGVRLQAASDNVIQFNTIYGNMGSGIFEKYKDKRSPAGHNIFRSNIVGYNALDGSSDYEIRIDRDANEKIVDHWINNLIVAQNGEDFTFKLEADYTGGSISEWLDRELHLEPVDVLVSRNVPVLEDPNSPSGWRSLIEGYGAKQPE